MDGLAAGGRGEGAAVGGVLPRVSRHQGGLRQPPEPHLYSTVQYSTVLGRVSRHQGGLRQPPEPHLGTLLLDPGQSRDQGGQGCVVHWLKLHKG